MRNSLRIVKTLNQDESDAIDACIEALHVTETCIGMHSGIAYEGDIEALHCHDGDIEALPPSDVSIRCDRAAYAGDIARDASSKSIRLT